MDDWGGGQRTAATATVFNKQNPEDVIPGAFQYVTEGTHPLGPA